MTTTIQVIQPDGETFIGTIESGSKVTVNGGPVEDRYVVIRQDGTKTYVFPARAQIRAVDPSAIQATAQAVPAPAPGVPGMPDLSHLAPTPGVSPGGPPPPLPPEVAATQAISGPNPTPVSMPMPGAPGAPAAAPIQFSAPPPGASRGGSQLAQPLPTPEVEAGPYIPPPSAPAAPPPRAPRPRPERFMVMPKSGKPKVFHTRDDCGKVSSEAKRLPVDGEAIEFWELVVCQSCQRRDQQMTFPEALVEALAEHGITLPQGVSAQVFDKIKGDGFNVTPQAVDR